MHGLRARTSLAIRITSLYVPSLFSVVRRAFRRPRCVRCPSQLLIVMLETRNGSWNTLKGRHKQMYTKAKNVNHACMWHHSRQGLGAMFSAQFNVYWHKCFFVTVYTASLASLCYLAPCYSNRSDVWLCAGVCVCVSVSGIVCKTKAVAPKKSTIKQFIYWTWYGCGQNVFHTHTTYTHARAPAHSFEKHSYICVFCYKLFQRIEAGMQTKDKCL